MRRERKRERKRERGEEKQVLVEARALRAWGLILIPPRERGVVDVTFMKCYNLCKP